MTGLEQARGAEQAAPRGSVRKTLAAKTNRDRVERIYNQHGEQSDAHGNDPEVKRSPGQQPGATTSPWAGTVEAKNKPARGRRAPRQRDSIGAGSRITFACRAV